MNAYTEHRMSQASKQAGKRKNNNNNIVQTKIKYNKHAVVLYAHIISIKRT